MVVLTGPDRSPMRFGLIVAAQAGVPAAAAVEEDSDDVGGGGVVHTPGLMVHGAAAHHRRVRTLRCGGVVVGCHQRIPRATSASEVSSACFSVITNKGVVAPTVLPRPGFTPRARRASRI